MTVLTDCHSSNTVIPTERGRSDEESRVCTPQSNETQRINCRSSRRFAPQDDRFGGVENSMKDYGFDGLITPLRMTGFGISIPLILVIPTEKPLGFDEESPVYTTQSSEAQSTYSRSSRRSFHSLLRMTSLTNCHSSDTVIPNGSGHSER